MDEEREQLIEVITSTQVADSKLFNGIRKESPLLARFMLDKFKQFLGDCNLTSMERQTILMKFFEEHKDYELLSEIIQHIDTLECKDDYTKIIMEWTFHNSENIVKSNLAKCDGAMLALRKEPEEPKKLNNKKETEDFINSIISVTLEAMQNGGMDGDNPEEGDTT